MGRHSARGAGFSQRGDEQPVGEQVELLHLFAVHVLLARFAEDVDEPRLVDLPGDHLRGQRDVVQEPREPAGGVGMLPLLVDEEAGDGEHVAFWHRRHDLGW